MRSRNSRRGRRGPGKKGLVLLAVLCIGSAALISSSSAQLDNGSSWDSTNGDLTSTVGLHDWNPATTTPSYLGPIQPINCATSTNCGLDLVKDSTDPSFGKGSKEDDQAPTVVTGSIPPSKDDLSRFYVNQEQQAGGHPFLYLAWERSNLLGSAHMDFELDQGRCDLTAVPTGCSANNVTPQRQAGDVLIDFDFPGSGLPVLASHTWLTPDTATSAVNCEASNALPCWDKAIILSAGTPKIADGSVNTGPVTDKNAPTTVPNPLPGNVTSNGSVNSTFGEASVDLLLAGIFPSGTCRSFGSTYLKSRSSGNSFSSELKDFIKPIPVNISNCGTIEIIKQSDPRGIDKDFGFTSNLLVSDVCSKTPPATFTLNDKGNTTTNSAANTQRCTSVPIGASRTITEDALPAGYTLESLNCTHTGSSTAVTDLAKRQVVITIAAGEDVVTCTYVDQQQLGAIKITKVSTKSGNQVLAGATFEIKKPDGTVVTSSASDAFGVVCVDGLTTLGTYTVQEKTAPLHYAIDDTTVHNVTVTGSNAKCSDATFGGQSLTFFDSPLTDVYVSVTSQDSGPGGSKSTITCTNDVGGADIGHAGPPALNPAVVDTKGLVPGNYTCKVLIDP